MGITQKPGREEKAYPLSVLCTRMSLLRGYCNRYARINEEGDYSVDTVLDPNHPRAAYHVGRLMAVLEMIQTRAQGEIGATIAQTHYAAAATRPIAALPRLETLVQHHVPKIDDFNLRREYQRLLTEINLAIGRTIPRTFDLEDQCLFHLGYYHQRAYAPYEEPPHRHTTFRGERVRSKSEVIVANLLDHMGIAYEYETPLCYKDDSIVANGENESPGAKKLLPDFTIRETKDGRPVFLEHLGMMDNFAYRNDWKWKESKYRDLQILPIEDGGGRNGFLVVTREERGTIDCQQLAAILKQLI